MIKKKKNSRARQRLYGAGAHLACFDDENNRGFLPGNYKMRAKKKYQALRQTIP